MPKTYTIGRDPAADIPIADPSVSRIHAEATLDEGDQIFLTDCNSSNGTYLLRHGGEQKIHQERLLITDQVKFGGVTIAVSALIAAIRRKNPGAFETAKPQGDIPPPPAAPQPVKAK
jgi:pSer/pThr/pTyr-binding forkhead associated (FHA) protein